MDTLQSWFAAEAALVAQLRLELGGRIVSSHIVTNESHDQTQVPSPAVQAERGKADHHHRPSPAIPSEAVTSEVVTGAHRAIQEALQSAAQRRREALTPYKNHLVQLLQDHVDNHNVVCSRNRPGLTQLRGRRAWSAVDIRQAIVDAYRIHVLENEELTHDQFVAEVQTAHLDSFLPEEFLPEPTPVVEHNNSFADSLERVQQAQDFQGRRSSIGSS